MICGPEVVTVVIFNDMRQSINKHRLLPEKVMGLYTMSLSRKYAFAVRCLQMHRFKSATYYRRISCNLTNCAGCKIGPIDPFKASHTSGPHTVIFTPWPSTAVLPHDSRDLIPPEEPRRTCRQRVVTAQSTEIHVCIRAQAHTRQDKHAHAQRRTHTRTRRYSHTRTDR